MRIGSDTVEVSAFADLAVFKDAIKMRRMFPQRLRNLQLGNKISPAVCIIGFMDIGADGSSAAQQLIRQGGRSVDGF